MHNAKDKTHADLTEQLAAAKAELSQLQQKEVELNAQLQQTTSQLEAAFKEAEAHKEHLEKEKETLNNDLSVISSKLKSLEEKSPLTEKKLDTLTSRFEEVTNKLGLKSPRARRESDAFADVTTKLDQLQSSPKLLLEENANLTAQLEEVRSQLGSKTPAEEDLESRLESQLQRARDLEEQNKELTKQVDEVTEMLHNLKNKKSHLVEHTELVISPPATPLAQQSHFDDRLAEQEKRELELLQEHEETLLLLEERDGEVSKLKAQLTEFEDISQKYSDAMKELESRPKSEPQSDPPTNEEETSSLRQQITDLTEKLSQLQTQNELLVTQSKNLEEANEDLEKQMDNAHSRIEEVVAAATDKINELTTELDKSYLSNYELEQTISELKSSLTEARDSIATAESKQQQKDSEPEHPKSDKSDDATSEIRHLNDLLSDKDQVIQNLQEDLKSQSSHLDELRSQQQQEVNLVKTLRADIRNLKAEKLQKEVTSAVDSLKNASQPSQPPSVEDSSKSGELEKRTSEQAATIAQLKETISQQALEIAAFEQASSTEQSPDQQVVSISRLLREKEDVVAKLKESESRLQSENLIKDKELQQLQSDFDNLKEELNQLTAIKQKEPSDSETTITPSDEVLKLRAEVETKSAELRIQHEIERELQAKLDKLSEVKKPEQSDQPEQSGQSVPAPHEIEKLNATIANMESEMALLRRDTRSLKDTNASLQRDNNLQKETTKDMTTNINKLKDEITERDDHIQRLEGITSQMQGPAIEEITKLRQTLQTKEQEVQSLEKQLAACNAQIQKLEAATSDSAVTIPIPSIEVTPDIEQRTAQLLKELDARDQHITELEAASKELKDDKKWLALLEEKDAQISLLTPASEELTALNTTMIEKENETKQLQKLLLEKDERIKVLSEQRTPSDVPLDTQESDDLRKKIEEKESQIKLLASKDGEEIERLGRTIREKELEASNLQEQLDRFLLESPGDGVAKLEITIREKDEEISQLIDAEIHLQQQLEDRDDKIKKLEAARTPDDEQITILKSAQQELQQKVSDRDAEIIGLKKALGSFGEEPTFKKEHLPSSPTSTRRRSSVSTNKSSENTDWGADVSVEAMRSLQEELTACKLEIKRLEAEVVSLTSKNDTLQLEYSTLVTLSANDDQDIQQSSEDPQRLVSMLKLKASENEKLKEELSASKDQQSILDDVESIVERPTTRTVGIGTDAVTLTDDKMRAVLIETKAKNAALAEAMAHLNQQYNTTRRDSQMRYSLIATISGLLGGIPSKLKSSDEKSIENLPECIAKTTELEASISERCEQAHNLLNLLGDFHSVIIQNTGPPTITDTISNINKAASLLCTYDVSTLNEMVIQLHDSFKDSASHFDDAAVLEVVGDLESLIEACAQLLSIEEGYGSTIQELAEAAATLTTVSPDQYEDIVRQLQDAASRLLSESSIGADVRISSMRRRLSHTAEAFAKLRTKDKQKDDGISTLREKLMEANVQNVELVNMLESRIIVTAEKSEVIRKLEGQIEELKRPSLSPPEDKKAKHSTLTPSISDLANESFFSLSETMLIGTTPGGQSTLQVSPSQQLFDDVAAAYFRSVFDWASALISHCSKMAHSFKSANIEQRAENELLTKQLNDMLDEEIRVEYDIDEKKEKFEQEQQQLQQLHSVTQEELQVLVKKLSDDKGSEHLLLIEEKLTESDLEKTTLLAKLQEATEQIITLTASNASGESLNRTLSEANARLNKQCTKLATENEYLLTTINAEKDDSNLDALKAELEEMHSKNKALESQVTTSKQQVETTMTQLFDEKEELARKNNDLVQQLIQISTRQQETSNDGSLAELRRKNEELTAKNDEFVKQLIELSAKVKASSQSPTNTDSVEEANKQLTIRNDELVKKLLETTQTADSDFDNTLADTIQAELESTRRELESTKKKLQERQDENTALSQHLIEITDVQIEAETELQAPTQRQETEPSDGAKEPATSQLADKISRLQLELSQQFSKITELETELETTTNKLKEEQSQNNNLTQQLLELTDAHLEIEEEMDSDRKEAALRVRDVAKATLNFEDIISKLQQEKHELEYELQIRLSSANTLRQSLSTEIQTLNEKLLAEEANNKVLMQQLLEITNYQIEAEEGQDFEKLREEMITLERQKVEEKHELEDQARRLRDDLYQLQRDNKNLKSQLETDKAQLTEEVAKLKTELTFSESQREELVVRLLDMAEGPVSFAGSPVGSPVGSPASPPAHASLSVLELDCEKLRKEATVHKLAIKDLEVSINTRDAENEILADKLRTSLASEAELRSRLSDANNQLVQFLSTKTIQDSHTTSQQLEVKLIELRLSLKLSEDKLQSEMKRNADFEQELKASIEQQEKLQEKIKTYDETEELHKVTIKDLQKRLIKLSRGSLSMKSSDWDVVSSSQTDELGPSDVELYKVKVMKLEQESNLQKAAAEAAAKRYSSEIDEKDDLINRQQQNLEKANKTVSELQQRVVQLSLLRPDTDQSSPSGNTSSENTDDVMVGVIEATENRYNLQISSLRNKLTASEQQYQKLKSEFEKKNKQSEDLQQALFQVTKTGSNPSPDGKGSPLLSELSANEQLGQCMVKLFQAQELSAQRAVEIEKLTAMLRAAAKRPSASPTRSDRSSDLDLKIDLLKDEREVLKAETKAVSLKIESLPNNSETKVQIAKLLAEQKTLVQDTNSVNNEIEIQQASKELQKLQQETAELTATTQSLVEAILSEVPPPDKQRHYSKWLSGQRDVLRENVTYLKDRLSTLTNLLQKRQSLSENGEASEEAISELDEEITSIQRLYSHPMQSNNLTLQQLIENDENIINATESIKIAIEREIASLQSELSAASSIEAIREISSTLLERRLEHQKTTYQMLIRRLEDEKSKLTSDIATLQDELTLNLQTKIERRRKSSISPIGTAVSVVGSGGGSSDSFLLSDQNKTKETLTHPTAAVKSHVQQLESENQRLAEELDEMRVQLRIAQRKAIRAARSEEASSPRYVEGELVPSSPQSNSSATSELRLEAVTSFSSEREGKIRDQELSELKGVLQESEDIRRKHAREESRLSDKIHSLQDQLVKLASSEPDKSEELRKAAIREENLRAQIKGMRDLLQNRAKDKAENVKEEELQQLRLRVLEQEYNLAEMESNVGFGKANELKKQVQQLEEEKKELIADVEVGEQIEQKLRAELNDAHARILTLTGSGTDYVAALKRKLTNSESNVKLLRDELSLSASIFETKIDELYGQKEEIVADGQKAAVIETTVLDQLHAMQSRLSRIKEEAAPSPAPVHPVSPSSEDSSRRRRQSTVEVAQLTSQLKVKDMDIKMLNDQVADGAETILDLESQLSSAKSTIENLEAKLTGSFPIEYSVELERKSDELKKSSEIQKSLMAQVQLLRSRLSKKSSEEPTPSEESMKETMTVSDYKDLLRENKSLEQTRTEQQELIDRLKEEVAQNRVSITDLHEQQFHQKQSRSSDTINEVAAIKEQYETTITDITKRNEVLQEELNAKIEEVEILRSSADDNTAGLTRQLQKSKEVEETLTSQLQLLRKRLPKHSADDSTKQSTEVQHLQTKLQEARLSADNLRAELDLLKGSSSDEELEQRNKQLTSQIKSLRTRLQETQQEEDRLQREVRDLKRKIAATPTSSTDSENESRDWKLLQEENKSLRAQLQALRRRIHSNKSDDDFNKLTNECDALRDENDSLISGLRQSTEVVDELQFQVQDLKQQNASLLSLQSDNVLQDGVKKLQEENQQLTSEIESLKQQPTGSQENETLREENRLLKGQLSAIRKRVQTKTDDNNQNTELITQLQSENDSLKTQLSETSALKEKFETLQIELVRANTREQKVITEMEGIKLNNNSGNMTIELQEARETITKLQTDLSNSAEAAAALRRQLKESNHSEAVLRDELAEMKLRLEDVETSSAEHSSAALEQNLTSQVKLLRNRVSELNTLKPKAQLWDAVLDGSSTPSSEHNHRLQYWASKGQEAADAFTLGAAQSDSSTKRKALLWDAVLEGTTSDSTTHSDRLKYWGSVSPAAADAFSIGTSHASSAIRRKALLWDAVQDGSTTIPTTSTRQSQYWKEQDHQCEQAFLLGLRSQRGILWDAVVDGTQTMWEDRDEKLQYWMDAAGHNGVDAFEIGNRSAGSQQDGDSILWKALRDGMANSTSHEYWSSIGDDAAEAYHWGTLLASRQPSDSELLSVAGTALYCAQLELSESTRRGSITSSWWSGMLNISLKLNKSRNKHKRSKKERRPASSPPSYKTEFAGRSEPGDRLEDLVPKTPIQPAATRQRRSRSKRPLDGASPGSRHSRSLTPSEYLSKVERVQQKLDSLQNYFDAATSETQDLESKIMSRIQKSAASISPVRRRSRSGSGPIHRRSMSPANPAPWVPPPGRSSPPAHRIDRLR
eukprot:TRINITY_DN281_c1_g2_i1.p1 TRINITY_DN281_c1_g2~~TRINITY_DN281_c1_g2_i1.p1  ORF type:complete len:4939 (+),score=1480.97 TRINITY_DN281_c1_g2_i1:1647-14819(+)